MLAEDSPLLHDYWVNKIKIEFSLTENEINQYKGPNENWLDFYKRLDGVFAFESVSATPEKLYELSIKYNTTITDAYQAFLLGRKYSKKPDFLLELFSVSGEWDKVEVAFSHYEEKKLELFEIKKSFFGDVSFQLASMLNLPQNVLVSLQSNGFTETELLGLGFLLEVSDDYLTQVISLDHLEEIKKKICLIVK